MYKNRTDYILCILFISVIFIINTGSQKMVYDEKVYVVLREAGHKLLLANENHSSLVLPVKKYRKNTYTLSFNTEFSIVPDSLVNILCASLKRIDKHPSFITEVIKCNTSEIVYSFQINEKEKESIVPCIGRNLPTDCYTINVKFIENEMKKGFLLVLFFFFASVLGIFLLLNSKNIKWRKKSILQIGYYLLETNNQKLCCQNIEFALTRKECELLRIFFSRPNVVVTRNEIEKVVWRDHGIIVGRSLDTYISKLRKKLVNDSRIKLKNIHGTGYKLYFQK